MSITEIRGWLELLLGRKPLTETADMLWFKTYFGYYFTDLTSTEERNKHLRDECTMNVKAFIIETLAKHTSIMMKIDEKPPVGTQILKYCVLHSPMMLGCYYVACYSCAKTQGPLLPPWNQVPGTNSTCLTNFNIQKIEEKMDLSKLGLKNPKISEISNEEWRKRFKAQFHGAKVSKVGKG